MMDNFVADLTEKFQPKLFRMRKSCFVWFLLVMGFLCFFCLFLLGYFCVCVCVPVEELYHQFLDHKYGM